MKNILIGATGSVATIKLPILVESLQLLDIEDEKIQVSCGITQICGTDVFIFISVLFQIRVIVTEHAKHFFTTDEIDDQVRLYSDSDEWSMWSKRGDPVLHIDLAKWADVFVLAPLDANTLAKIANVNIFNTRI